MWIISIIFILILKFLGLIVPLLISVAYLTLLERKIIAAVQRRKGPNHIGFVGLLQPLADGLKLFVKECIIPIDSNGWLFIAAPILTFFFSLLHWSVIPFSKTTVFASSPISVLFLLAFSSLGLYGLLFAGWSSNSKYAFLGALRSAAQMISYEVSLGLIIIPILIIARSASLSSIVIAQEYIWFCIPFFPLCLMFFISILAETNRAPFDLPESEAELVAGYNVEYSGMGFALFFLGEYGNMIAMSSFITLLFFGGWSFFYLDYFLLNVLAFSLKTVFILTLIIFTRALLPRYRYDQLMRLGWKVFLPLALGITFFVSGLMVCLNPIYFVF